MPVREKGEGAPVCSLRVPSHVPSQPQTAAKVRGSSLTASTFTAETDWLLEGTGFELGPAEDARRLRRCRFTLAPRRSETAVVSRIPLFQDESVVLPSLRIDHRIDIRSAAVEYDLRSGAEPVIVGAHPVDADRWGTVGDAEAEHLVTRIARRVGRLHRDPGVHGEYPAPRDCAGVIDLDHRLRRGCRIGRKPGGIAPRLVLNNGANPYPLSGAERIEFDL